MKKYYCRACGKKTDQYRTVHKATYKNADGTASAKYTLSHQCAVCGTINQGRISK